MVILTEDGYYNTEIDEIIKPSEVAIDEDFNLVHCDDYGQIIFDEDDYYLDGDLINGYVYKDVLNNLILGEEEIPDDFKIEIQSIDEVQEDETMQVMDLDVTNLEETNFNDEDLNYIMDKDNYTLIVKKINLAERCLVVPSYIKESRKDTSVGLNTSVKQIGVVTPVHVLALYPDDIKEDELDILGEDGTVDNKRYLLLDGYRRVRSALYNNMQEIVAEVWCFKDVSKALKMALPLTLHINKTAKRTIKETWSLLRALEEAYNIQKIDIKESLLDLNPGEYAILTDVMLSNYQEIKEVLMSGEKTLAEAYKLLVKARKEENKLENEDKYGINEINDESVQFETYAKKEVSDEEINNLLDLESSEDFGDLENYYQFGGDEKDRKTADKEFDGFEERQPISKERRDEVIKRDGAKCQCCGRGEGYAAFVVHHKIPWHVILKMEDNHLVKDPDAVENLITLCDTCHQTLHVMEKNGGKFLISEERFNTLPKEQQDELNEILKLVLIAIKAAERVGKRGKIEVEIPKHRMPGAGVYNGS